MRLIFLVMFSALGLAGCAEQIPLASGALTGAVKPMPSSWDAVVADEIIQLETQGDSPYSVNLWTVLVDGDLHVFAGDNYATWVEHIENDPAVRLQSEGSIYLFQAERVTQAAVFERFAQAWESKYGNRPRNENVEETYLFRLKPTPAQSL